MAMLGSSAYLCSSPNCEPPAPRYPSTLVSQHPSIPAPRYPSTQQELGTWEGPGTVYWVSVGVLDLTSEAAPPFRPVRASWGAGTGEHTSLVPLPSCMYPGRKATARAFVPGSSSRLLLSQASGLWACLSDLRGLARLPVWSLLSLHLPRPNLHDSPSQNTHMHTHTHTRTRIHTHTHSSAAS